MRALPIAFSTLAFPGASLASVISLGRSWGFAGVELRLIDGELIDPSMPPATRETVRKTLAAGGLPVVAVDSSVRLTDGDPGPELRQFLELASDWESPLVRVFGGSLDKEAAARRGQIEGAARVLEAAAPLAERLGVAIGVETHDDFSASSVVAELLAMVKDPSVGAVWDSHHPFRMGERPAEVLANLGSRVLLAQVKDAKLSTAQQSGWQLVPLGEGEVPVREMLGLLIAGGYQGWLSVEWEKHWHPEIDEPQIALPQHLKLLGTWLAELPEQELPEQELPEQELPELQERHGQDRHG